MQPALVRNLYQQGSWFFLTSLSITLVAEAVLWGIVPIKWLLSWLALQVLVSAGGFFLLRLYWVDRNRDTRLGLWYRRFTLICVAVGSAWGLLAAFFDPTWHPGRQIMLLLLLLIVALGNGRLLVAHHLSALSFSSLVWLPMVARLLATREPDFVLVGLVSVGFVMFFYLWHLPRAHKDLIISLQLSRQAQRLVLERDTLAKQAMNDLLTGLPNRRALDEHLERALARCANSHGFLVVLALDPFDFKRINLSASYAVGDQVLQQLADRLRKVLRASDFVARLGGDEFVVVYESIEHLEEIELLLEQLHGTLTATFEVGDHSLQLDIHAGLAIYPLTEVTGVSELLHAAEQALDQAQNDPDRTALWWRAYVADATEDPAQGTGQLVTPQGHHRLIYGPDAAHLLHDVQTVCAVTTERFVQALHQDLFKRLHVQAILSLFNTEEWQQFDAYLIRHVAMLTSLDLDQVSHAKNSIRAGRLHEMMGIQEAWVDEIYASWERIFIQHPGHLSLAVQMARPIIKRRFTADLESQRTGRLQIRLEREDAATEIDNLAWRSRQYVDLIEGTAKALGNLQEVVAVALSRPDEHSVLRHEAVSSGFSSGAHDLSDTQQVPSIHVDAGHPRGHCPSGRAWRSGQIERSPSVSLDPNLEAWKSLAKQQGIRSMVAIPLHAGHAVRSILTLYLAYYGGFAGPERQKLLERIQRMLSMGLEQFLRTEELPGLQYLQDRKRYTQLLDGNGLVMLFQPILDLHTGKLAKVEALARLRQDGEWISPAQFLPLFGRDELFTLYRKGLEQSLQTLRTWSGQGLRPDLSINLSPQGLADPRYLEATRQVLASLPLPDEQQLILELLETEDFDIYSRFSEIVTAWKELGVSFAEDDLGSGYSNLARLRSFPFQFVKVDQALVTNFEKEPFKVLHLIEQLISLAHGVGAMVAIEGLESHGLVETAAIFGADFGQGYAIAKPMEADLLPEWTKNHIPWRLDRTRPATLPGLLALFLRNEKRVTEMQDWPGIARILVREGIHAEWFSGLNSPADQTLQAAFHTLKELMIQHAGQPAPDYLQARERFLSLMEQEFSRGTGGNL